MSISAKDVKELRERTGAGMMDCKKALNETGGDMEKAATWLREKGIASAAKRSGRVAAEGAVASYVQSDAKVGALAEVNCETDFVARGDRFQELCRDICVQICSAKPRWVRREDVPQEVVDAEKEAYNKEAADGGKSGAELEKAVEDKIEAFFKKNCLLEQPYINDSKVTIEAVVKELSGQVGEKIDVRRFARYELGEPLTGGANGQERGATEGVIATYIHMGGKVGVLVEVNCESDSVAQGDEFQNLCKELCLQICWSSPGWVRPEDVPQDIINAEKEIYKKQMADSGKPDNVLDKIAEGKLKKFFEENCLIEQPYVREPKTTVGALIKEVSGKIGEKIDVRRFVRYELGEGIEKQESNFAEEVAAELRKSQGN